MTSNTKDFYGKEVTDAIKKACDKLQVPQEQLEIEVVETGSTGIFGLIRKKAHIRASVRKSDGQTAKATKAKTLPPKQQKPSATAVEDDRSEAASAPISEAGATAEREKAAETPPQAAAEKGATENRQKSRGSLVAERQPEKPEEDEKPEEQKEHRDQSRQDNGAEEDESETSSGPKQNTDQENTELPESILLSIKEELNRILELMGYPSTVEISASGTSVVCRVGEEHEAALTGQDGKTLDSLQYLLRKIIARKVPDRLRLSVDVGNYRQKRLDELKEQALELAGRVREDGKTQVIAALSPSERRVIHMSLQEDKEIRSRSVGDGLFKKILIYKPGKGGGKGGGRKRNNSRGRRGGNNRKKSD